MNKKGLTFTLTTWLIIAIGVVALSTAGVITASYLSNGSSGSGTNKNTNTNPTSGASNISSTIHLECRTNQCVVVQGTGTNQCPTAGTSCGTIVTSSSSSSGSSSSSSSSSSSASLKITVPSSGQVFGSNLSIPLNYTIKNSSPSGCTYSVDNNASINLDDCENTTFNVFSNGTHTVKVTAGTLTDTNSFSVSFDAPSITLTSPSNSSVMANGTVLVSYVASEIPAGDLESCELWGNFNGTYMKNQTNSTVLSGSTSQFTITSLKNGTYLWAISCLDKESHRSTTGNWTLSVDTIPPAIVLSDPKGMYNRTSLLPLNFGVQDTSPVTCWYNVTSITGGPAVISRSVPGCMNTTFNVPDGNYTLTLQAQAGGLTSFASANFLVNTSGAATLLTFLAPTPSNGSIINGSEFIINVSAVEPLALSRYVAVDLNHTFVTWVRMDDTTPDGSIMDISPYASEVQTSGTTVVPGRFGSALHFENSSDGLKIKDSSTIDFTKAFTVSFWFNGNSSTAGQFLVGKWDGMTTGEIAWEVSLATGGVCNGLDFYVSRDGGSVNRVYARNCNQTYQDGQWHQFVGVFEPGQNITIYVDKSTAGTTVVGNVSDITSVHQNNNDVYIGSRPSGSYNGSIDELLLFGRALNSQEAGALFGAGNSPYWKNFTNLMDGTYGFIALSTNTAGIKNQT